MLAAGRAGEILIEGQHQLGGGLQALHQLLADRQRRGVLEDTAFFLELRIDLEMPRRDVVHQKLDEAIDACHLELLEVIDAGLVQIHEADQHLASLVQPAINQLMNATKAFRRSGAFLQHGRLLWHDPNDRG